MSLSVVIVSRARPRLLARALTALDQQRDVEFEVVVAADDLAPLAPWEGRVKALRFGEANISAARNAAAGIAAGGVLAFLDDDAVPEPTWAARLLAAFDDPDVSLAATMLLGPDGIRPQYGLRSVTPDGIERPLDAPPGLVTAGGAVRTEGASMGIRREALSALGGFDPAFRFYMDETELNLRAQAAGLRTAWVPGAVAHHGLAPSESRAPSRAPRALRQVGASVAILSRRHGGDPARMRAGLRAGQRDRLARHLNAGRMEPREAARLMADLDAGWEEGMARALPPLGPLPAPAAFLPFGPRVTGPPAFLHGASGGHAMAEARARLARGCPSTVLILSAGAARHAVRFEEGVWVQRGGRWGRSGPGIRRGLAPEARAAAERARVADVRALPRQDARMPGRPDKDRTRRRHDRVELGADRLH